MGQFLLFWLLLIVRNRWLFLGIFLLVSAFGYLLRFISGSYYKTEAVLITHNLSADVAGYLIHNVDKYANEARNLPMLTTLLGVSDHDAESILSMQVEKIADTTSIDRYDSTVSVFKIVLVNTDTSALDGIQKGIVNILENNDYSVKRKESRKKTIQALVTGLQQRMQSLDSLKHPEILSQGNIQGLLSRQALDPVLAYDEELYFYREQLKLDQELNSLDNVTLLQPFLKYNHFNYPDFTAIFRKYILIGLLLAVLLTPVLGIKRLT